MSNSKFLAKAMGIYLAVISIAMFLNMTQFADNITKLMNDPTLVFVIGFTTLIVGILLILSHNIWQWNWRLIITIVSWITFLKAVAILIYPPYINFVSNAFVQNINLAYVAASIDLILGLLLCYFGFKK